MLHYGSVINRRLNKEGRLAVKVPLWYFGFGSIGKARWRPRSILTFEGKAGRRRQRGYPAQFLFGAVEYSFSQNTLPPNVVIYASSNVHFQILTSRLQKHTIYFLMGIQQTQTQLTSRYHFTFAEISRKFGTGHLDHVTGDACGTRERPSYQTATNRFIMRRNVVDPGFLDARQPTPVFFSFSFFSLVFFVFLFFLFLYN